MATAAVTNDFVASTTIVSDDVDTNFNDLVSFLNASVVHVDGAKAMTGALAMGTNKITGLAAASSNGDALRWEQFNGHAHTGSTISALAAADTTSGTFNADRIPNLPTSKITSGTFNADRIPNLPTSKITSGTFSTSRIPDLNASKINAGTFGTGSYTFQVNVGIAGAFNANTSVDFIGLLEGGGTTMVISGGSVRRLSSSRAVKDVGAQVDVGTIRAGLANLPVYEFTYKGEDIPQLGWMAEDVATVDPRLVHFEDGKPVSINQLAIQAVLA